jgi:hypothetical protein
LNLTLQEIQKVVDELEKDSKALKKEIYKMSWYMRGAVSLDEAYMLDFQDRQIIGEIIKENLEVTKESNLPFF